MSKKISAKSARLITAVIGFLMTVASIYLTNHYFEIHFPTQYNIGSFCNISQFWNCDAAAFSPLGSVFGVPTSLFGVIFGFFIMIGALLNTKSVRETNFFLSALNLLGCVALFIYSLIFLGGLCPGCTIYYVLSLFLIAVFVCAKNQDLPKPKFAILLAYGGVGIAVMSASLFYNKERIAAQEVALQKWVLELKQARVYDDSALDFSFALVKATDDFKNAPLRITIFSDFQCPFCKILGNEIEKISSRYRGKLNVRYLFFPLDSKCNDKLSSQMHPFACAAARLAYCAKNNFVSIHDQLYEHQTDLSEQWILDKSKELGLKECYENSQTQEAVKDLIDSADGFDVDAAPHMLVNGRKISGLIPSKALVTLLDALLVSH
ncbi:MAG: thioredoxin domain-containing protein [Myxococcales bacterium]|nr:thioredoxin domain-containing protein [Myxococcales bacterium]USN51265.1 MAG: thioredoxin domain-containing protein [Myxococcales bacterium]